MRIKDNFETTGGIDMKKVALVLVIVSVFIMLLSVAEAAIELPLRVEVNGERVYFPDEQPFIDSTGGPRYRRDL